MLLVNYINDSVFIDLLKYIIETPIEAIYLSHSYNFYTLLLPVNFSNNIFFYSKYLENVAWKLTLDYS